MNSLSTLQFICYFHSTTKKAKNKEMNKECGISCMSISGIFFSLGHTKTKQKKTLMNTSSRAGYFYSSYISQTID